MDASDAALDVTGEHEMTEHEMPLTLGRAIL
jgi:hypothetical protein